MSKKLSVIANIITLACMIGSFIIAATTHTVTVFSFCCIATVAASQTACLLLIDLSAGRKGDK